EDNRYKDVALKAICNSNKNVQEIWGSLRLKYQWEELLINSINWYCMDNDSDKRPTAAIIVEKVAYELDKNQHFGER
ncbi:17486_t:CDS:2, partial [Gigaspora margarita]